MAPGLGDSITTITRTASTRVLVTARAIGSPFAAFVVEPVQGEAGAVVPPPGYLRKARELCTRYGTLLVADEVQTGLGRTGAMWGVDHDAVQPDVMCLGKSLGGGVMPLSAFVSTPTIWECLVPNPVIHSTTFGGNPLACVAGIAAILPNSWGDSINPYLPSSAGEAIMAIQTQPHTLTAWAGFGTFCAYTGIAIAAAAVLLVRRDA